jgi:hypothetical protein
MTDWSSYVRILSRPEGTNGIFSPFEVITSLALGKYAKLPMPESGAGRGGRRVGCFDEGV